MKQFSLVPFSEIPVAQDVPTDDLVAIYKIISHMECICDKEEGIGLSAVQIGIPWKLFIVKNGLKYDYYVNCEYQSIGPIVKSIEGCLSLKDSQGQIRRFSLDRYSKVSLKGKQLKIQSTDLFLEDIDRVEEGLYAIVFQHEIDHQNQTLISQIGKEIELG